MNPIESSPKPGRHRAPKSRRFGRPIDVPSPRVNPSSAGTSSHPGYSRDVDDLEVLIQQYVDDAARLRSKS